jgi:hypothetical protein
MGSPSQRSIDINHGTNLSWIGRRLGGIVSLPRTETTVGSHWGGETVTCETYGACLPVGGRWERRGVGRGAMQHRLTGNAEICIARH